MLLAGNPPPEVLEERVLAEFDVLSTVGRADGAVLLTGYHEPVVEVSDRPSAQYPVPGSRAAGGLHAAAGAYPRLPEPGGDRGRPARSGGPASRVGARPDRRLLHGGGGKRHPPLPGRARDAHRPRGHQRSPVPVDRTASHRRGAAHRGDRLHGRDPLVARGESVGARPRPPAQPVRRLLQAARGAAPREPRRAAHPGPLHRHGRASCSRPAGLAFVRTERPSRLPDGRVGWSPVSRFVLNQDTGGAIRGPGRVDCSGGAAATPSWRPAR